MLNCAGKMSLSSNPGVAWVERFLLPHLQRRFDSKRSLSCLQIAPDDDCEAVKLRELGHTCDLLDAGVEMPLPLDGGAYDFALTGRFPSIAPDDEARRALARELYRVLRSGGSLLIAVGNRLSPIDLSRNGPLIHGPFSKRCLTLRQSAADFQDAGFAEVVPLAVNGHFGWGSVPGYLRPIGRLLDAYWRYLVTPANRLLYGSPLNPVLLLWINKN